ncbi:MAG: hypothetical protein HOM58_21935 [Rhodospirillaceae bacterium]|jgi:hypothetical protein|nr:hypothetical protein [Rhodospirillaceae bacterium]
MKAFEIHTFKDGQWKIDSVFDDRELALHEARKVEEGGRYARLRVIEENYDEVSDLTTTRTIYRGGSANQNDKKRRATAPRKTGTSRPHGGVGEEAVRKSRTDRSQSQKTNVLVPVLVLLILILAGVAAMFAMQYFSLQK